MLFLAWYTLVWSLLMIAGDVVRDNVKGGIRLLGLILNIPVFIFALLYLLN
jgi:hypothetical protein